MEIELKLVIEPADIPRLKRHPLLKGAPRPVTQKLHSVYYDTPRLDLITQGLALRLRRTPAGWMQTVKGGGSVAAGLHRRQEWETEVAGATPDFTRLDDPHLRRIFAPAELRRQFHPVFVTEFSRAACRLDQGGVELCLDQGEIRSGTQSEPLCEIELELHAGSAARLFELALELQKTVPLRLESRSKAERGYALYRGTPYVPVKAAPTALSRELAANAAFRIIAWNCLEHLQANLRGMLQGDDPEFLHQMRVALRRLRSACKAFAVSLPAALREELAWFMQQFGPARDWDVFVTQTLPPVLAQFPRHAGLAEAARDAAARRAAARQAAQQAADSQRWQRWLLSLGAWLEGDALPVQETQTLPQFAAALLEKRHGKLRKRGRHPARLDDAQRHALRIAAKRLRYAAEFFAPLYAPKPARAYVTALAELQDVLGALNDAATTQRLLGELAPPHAAAARREALGILSGWSAAISDLRLQRLQKAWGDFVREKTFWEKP